MAEPMKNDYAKYKRRNESEAEFKSRVARDKAAAPAEDARREQFRKDEERRQQTPGYMQEKAGMLKKKLKPLFSGE